MRSKRELLANIAEMIAEQVEHAVSKYQFVGEVMATLNVNRERGHLTLADEEADRRLGELIAQWNKQHSEALDATDFHGTCKILVGD